MALDEATTALLAQLAESGARPMHELTPEDARAQFAVMREGYGPGPAMARVTDDVVVVADGSFRVRVLYPTEDPSAVIVYYHGGGWVIGDIDQFDSLGRALAHRSGCAVVLVDYRLAPEHRYPVAAQDSWAALEWAWSRLADPAGKDTQLTVAGDKDTPLIVAGDSAGGNLAAVVAQRAKVHGGPPISLQVLIYPVTDHDFDTESYRDPENQLVLTRESMIWFWDHYAPRLESRRDTDASPMRRSDLSGLPPAIILTAEHDVLRDEGEAYAARLSEAGVPVRHRRFPGQMHGFFGMLNVLPSSEEGLGYVAQELERHLAEQSTRD